MGYKIVNDDSLTDVADAIRVQGSISGTLEFPDGFVSAIQNLSPSPTLQTKTKTYTPTTSQQTESVTADSGYDGLSEVDVTVNAIPSQYKDTTDATATADKILSGYTAYANGQKLTGTASGGITPSGTISITQNGQVDVTNYALADVNVSGGGGASNLVHGEFNTGSTTGTTKTVTVSYTGNGYPIAGVFVIKGGMCNNTASGDTNWFSKIQRYAVGRYSFMGCIMTEAPRYSTNASDYAVVTATYKSSSSVADSYATNGNARYNFYNGASPAGNTRDSCIRMHSKTEFQVYVATNSYGLLADTDYEYYIIYSS